MPTTQDIFCSTPRKTKGRRHKGRVPFRLSPMSPSGVSFQTAIFCQKR
jgi:hypothetical protein